MNNNEYFHATAIGRCCYPSGIRLTSNCKIGDTLDEIATRSADTSPEGALKFLRNHMDCMDAAFTDYVGDSATHDFNYKFSEHLKAAQIHERKMWYYTHKKEVLVLCALEYVETCKGNKNGVRDDLMPALIHFCENVPYDFPMSAIAHFVDALQAIDESW